MTTKSEIISQSILRLQENTPRIERCLQLLTDEQIWNRPNTETNSIGNLILHLCGNITQYIISSIGEEVDTRERDLEFSATQDISTTDLMQKLEAGIVKSVKVIEGLSEAELLKERSVQGYTFTGIGSIIHVVEHYSYHTGQIAFLTKLQVKKDLGFYANLDLNIKNV
jgi:uncharacterized damage-inducible protein DinB